MATTWESVRPLPPGAKNIDNPAILGCGGGCGKVVTVPWPSELDPALNVFRHELHKRGWFLGVAETEVQGERFYATVVLCQRCGSKALAPPKLSP